MAVKETPEFVARFKVFALARWLDSKDWSSDEPHAVLSTVADELGEQGSGTFVLQAAAHVSSQTLADPKLLEEAEERRSRRHSQILKNSVSERTKLAHFQKLVTRVFPADEAAFEPYAQKVTPRAVVVVSGIC